MHVQHHTASLTAAHSRVKWMAMKGFERVGSLLHPRNGHVDGVEYSMCLLIIGCNLRAACGLQVPSELCMVLSCLPPVTRCLLRKPARPRLACKARACMGASLCVGLHTCIFAPCAMAGCGRWELELPAHRGFSQAYRDCGDTAAGSTKTATALWQCVIWGVTEILPEIILTMAWQVLQEILMITTSWCGIASAMMDTNFERH